MIRKINKEKEEKELYKMKIFKIKTIIVMLVLLQGCQWEHDGEVVKDKDGNLYILEASGIRNESYDLKPLPTNAIDSILLR